MSDRYPGYDVLSKRDTPSWNAQTRAALDERLSVDPDAHVFLDDAAWRTLRAVCDRVVPQPRDRARPAPVAAMIDLQLLNDQRDGFRRAELPPIREAWRRGLAAFEAEAKQRHGRSFHALAGSEQDALLKAVQRGEARRPEWDGMPPASFFAHRLLPDLVGAYYADPHGWNEIGFGGPASPRGYVRMGFDRRDPWEASEAKPGREERARKENARVG